VNTPVPEYSSPTQYGKYCACPAKAGLCNLTDCQQPWATAERKSTRPTVIDRIIGTIVAILGAR
jgi:hypothetical protein